MMFKIENISKNFGNVSVLKNISFSVEDRTILGLVGPSGSGKSTLLRCIEGLETCDQGQIHISGHKGFMFQDFQLFPHMTVMENLVYAPRLKDKKTDFQSKALELLKDLGMPHKESNYPHQLSGGQKQRVALARSLMMDPTVLLCDEPTSGLDVMTTSDVIELLESVRSRGVSMVIASHDLDFLSKLADRIILLKNGSIVADVAPKTMADPIATLMTHY